MNDHDIRTALHKILSSQFLGLEPEIIPELGLAKGSTRVDLAVVARSGLYGYEIKSDEDVLTRLPGQVRYYSEVLDYASVVTTSKYLEEVWGEIPLWWGVYEASNDFGKVRIRVRRVPERNPTLDVKKLTKMLWRDEALAILERKGETRGLKTKAKRFAWERIQQVCSRDEIRAHIRDRLKARTKMASVNGWKLSR